jgi:hypothetical protein
VERLLVGFVERFGEGRHETPARGTAAELGEIDNTDERFADDHPAKRGAHVVGDRHIGMATAENHDRITRRRAIGARAQSPPHAERIDNRYVRAGFKQLFDEPFCGVGLPRTRRADDRNAFIERVEGQGGGENVAADGRGARFALSNGG